MKYIQSSPLTAYLIASLLQLVENQIHMVNSYVAWLVGWVNHMKAKYTKPDPPFVTIFPVPFFFLCIWKGESHIYNQLKWIPYWKSSNLLFALLKGKCF